MIGMITNTERMLDLENIIKKQLDQELTINHNIEIADGVYEMSLTGDTSLVTAPGQFINIKLPGFYLRRPISICEYDMKDHNGLVIIYKVVGQGTDLMSGMQAGDKLWCLMGLGNGFDVETTGDHVLLVGGGVGTPPMYGLAKELLMKQKKVTVVLGFASKKDAFYIEKFEELGKNMNGSDIEVRVATVDGSLGTKGFVTDCLEGLDTVTDYCACGPIPMLKALYGYYDGKITGQLSFEERMGCGFGACVGCSIATKSGNKKVCKDGPVFLSSDIEM
jgi:dihydroorotate dehydrogenase electron transfer subunit